MSTKAQVKKALRQQVNPEKAEFLPRFFKTGPGQYGEGDVFLGVVVPDQRRIARQFRDLRLVEVARLLDDPIHECRMTGLLILVEQYQRGDDAARQAVFDLYFDKLDRVNNWDLVDATAHKIVGPQLEDGDRSLLDQLADTPATPPQPARPQPARPQPARPKPARSQSNSAHSNQAPPTDPHRYALWRMWRQRVAMIATYHFIREGDFRDAQRIARKLLNHPHDLIHKAVGWMLREIGNRDEPTLTRFLKTRYRKMPRTMLRYAIERLPEPTRKAYLNGDV